jgi:hypothetical protein
MWDSLETERSGTKANQTVSSGGAVLGAGLDVLHSIIATDPSEHTRRPKYTITRSLRVCLWPSGNDGIEVRFPIAIDSPLRYGILVFWCPNGRGL